MKKLKEFKAAIQEKTVSKTITYLKIAMLCLFGVFCIITGVELDLKIK